MFKTMFSCALVALIAGAGLVLGEAGAFSTHGPALAEAAFPAVAFGGLIINGANLQTLGVGFKTAFQRGLKAVEKPDWKRVATHVPSTTSKEEYGWLGDWPEIREWVGERVVKELKAHDYAIKNREFESTVAVKRPHIQDDNLGIYGPRFETLGNRVANFPNKLVFQALKDAWTKPCYDGQPLIDADHPLIDSNGQARTVSNDGGGVGAPWFLMVTSMPLKPVLYQERQKFDFVAKEDPKDDTVFRRNEFLWGVDGRANVGYGFWQMIYGSKQPLTAANYEAALAAFADILKDAEGEPLGFGPDLLVTGRTNLADARKVLKAQLIDGGNSNVWYESADLMITDWL